MRLSILMKNIFRSSLLFLSLSKSNSLVTPLSHSFRRLSVLSTNFSFLSNPRSFSKIPMTTQTVAHLSTVTMSDTSVNSLPRYTPPTRLNPIIFQAKQRLQKQTPYQDNPSLTSVSSSTPLPIFTIRQADLDDIMQLNRCNMENLPENYSKEFYEKYLRDFGDYCFVALDQEGKVIGYALSRIELQDTRTMHEQILNIPIKEHKFEGHLTSIAVNAQYRGSGLSQLLLSLVHTSIYDRFPDIQKITLYCKTSNAPGISLYSRSGYTIDRTIPNYYNDGQDAFYMSVDGADVPKIRPLIFDAQYKHPELLPSL